jgi:hypothetical protein
MTTPKPASDAFRRFEQLTKKLLGVPRSELEKKRRAYERAKEKRRG